MDSIILFTDIFNYVLTAILIAVSGTWIFFIKSMIDSFRLSPQLDKFKNTSKSAPKVSIILPARDEEKFIRKCLDSLIKQDYKNYEIIVIDDSSKDATGKIITEYAEAHSNIIAVSARPKPDGWMGKNWACMEGYKKVTGDLLLFTDADTVHAKNVISLAVAHLNTFDLDALSVMPKLLTYDFWTNITLPLISAFLHTRFSPLNVNNPAKKTGYFFGSFFILKNTTYQEIGTHKAVKHEIIEDAALGRKVKESGYKLKMVRGEHLIDAVWAREKNTLWHGLKRLIIPLYIQDKKIGVGVFLAVLFLLFVPFLVFGVSVLLQVESASAYVLCISSAVASILAYIGTIIEVKVGLKLKSIYIFFAPLGGLVVVSAFLSGLLQATTNSAVEWRGRSYSIGDGSHMQKTV